MEKETNVPSGVAETGAKPKRSRVRRGKSGYVKLADVARLANVSTATASRVINTPGAVKEQTRIRVEQAIAELGWIPHGPAQALASLRSKTVGALIPTLGHQAIAVMLENLQRTLGEAGYTLVLGRPDESDERTVRQALNMVQSGVECLVLMGEDQPPELFAMLKRRNIFHVIIYTTGAFGHDNCIGFDNYSEMARLTRHLLEMGHTRFGLISRFFDRNDRLRLRVNAVRDTLALHGLAVRPQHFQTVDNWTITSGRKGMRQILEHDDPPTAVICSNDYLAAGALVEARASGLRVPEDVSITGFDDVELAAHIDPPLTTMRVPSQLLGETIARYVIDAIEFGETELPPPLAAELVIRKSAGPPRRHALASGTRTDAVT